MISMARFLALPCTGVITFFTWFGLVLARFKDNENAQTMIKMLDAANDVFMVMIHQVIKITPIGAFAFAV